MTRLIPHPFADKSAYQETRSSTNDARRRLPYTERRKMLLLYVVIQSVLYPSQVFMYRPTTVYSTRHDPPYLRLHTAHNTGQWPMDSVYNNLRMQYGRTGYVPDTAISRL